MQPCRAASVRNNIVFVTQVRVLRTLTMRNLTISMKLANVGQVWRCPPDKKIILATIIASEETI